MLTGFLYTQMLDVGFLLQKKTFFTVETIKRGKVFRWYISKVQQISLNNEHYHTKYESKYAYIKLPIYVSIYRSAVQIIPRLTSIHCDNNERK